MPGLWCDVGRGDCGKLSALSKPWREAKRRRRLLLHGPSPLYAALYAVLYPACACCGSGGG